MTLRMGELERFATLALRLLVFIMISIDAAEWPGREWDDCLGWDEERDERLQNKREGRKCETVKGNWGLRYCLFFHNLIENEHLFRCSIQIKKFTASLSCVFYRISSTRKENYSFHVFQNLYDLLSSVGHKRRCLEGCSCCSFLVNREQDFQGIVILRDGSPKNEISIVIYSPSYHYLFCL